MSVLPTSLCAARSSDERLAEKNHEHVSRPTSLPVLVEGVEMSAGCVEVEEKAEREGA
jgi:hypothetical protein